MVLFAVQVARFWREHKTELVEVFPPPPHERARLEKQTDHLANLTASLTLGPNLIYIEAVPDGEICAAVSDWPSFLQFKNEYQAYTNSDFVVTQTELAKNGRFIQRSYCRWVCEYVVAFSSLAILLTPNSHY